MYENTMIQIRSSWKIDTDTASCHGMDNKSNFELNLQKWVCLGNSKFQFLHIPSQLKNIIPLTFPWNTHYYAGIFTIFDCKQRSMALCQPYQELSTLTDFPSYGHRSTYMTRQNAQYVTWVIKIGLNNNYLQYLIPKTENVTSFLP